VPRHLPRTQLGAAPASEARCAGEVTDKINGGGSLAAVASGEVEIAIPPVSELVNVPGIDFVGPVPEGLQYLSIFSAAIVAGSKQVDAGQRLIHFLGSEEAEATITRQIR
jgi:molybdate transport system substrate-binding protein